MGSKNKVRKFVNLDTGLFTMALFDGQNNLLGASGVTVRAELIECDHVMVNDKWFYDVVGISECGDSVIVELN